MERFGASFLIAGVITFLLGFFLQGVMPVLTLTSIPTKFDARYVLEAIIDPSKDISDQYGMYQVRMKDGAIHAGLYVENGPEASIYPPDPKAEPVVVKTAEVAEAKPMPVSQMPPGLINLLNPSDGEFNTGVIGKQ